MAQVSESHVAAFRAAFAGDVVTPGDTLYDDARSVWNGDIDRQPALIARCISADDVSDAVRFGTEHDLEISVRGGGHSYSGASVVQDGLMIDLSRMNQVEVNPVARTAACGGGATWAAVDAATQAHGLATVGGNISHTGVGGLTLGGGMGWLTPKLGLTIDTLQACELVTADGRILEVSASERPELFWALRGGGGNFGVITRFEFRLQEVGPLVNMGLFFWTADRGGEALRFCRDLFPTLPEDMGLELVAFNAPPAPFVPEQYHFAPGYALVIAGFGSPEEHERAVRPILEAGGPQFHVITPMPYVELQRMLDDSAPWGIRGYEKGLSTALLSDQVIDVMTENFPRKSSPMSLVIVFYLRGAYSGIPDDATAFGGSREPQYVVTIPAVAPTPELLEADRAWARSFWNDLLPYSSRGSGGYVNFMTDYEDERVRAAYGAKYGRLARIKAEYDPGNVFHRNMNVKPSPIRVDHLWVRPARGLSHPPHLLRRREEMNDGTRH